VTHDQIEAMTLADRLAVLDHGRLEQVGPPAEVYRRPASRFVAGFLGSPSMNFLDGHLVDDVTVALPDGGHLRLKAGPAVVPADRRVTLGIRPEDIQPAAAGEPENHEHRSIQSRATTRVHGFPARPSRGRPGMTFVGFALSRLSFRSSREG